MSSTSFLTQLLDNVPEAWLNTTYPNDVRFVGRQAFMDEMVSILEGKTKIDPVRLGSIYPEDYLRLGSPFSTLLEVTHAMDHGFEPKNVFSFASTTLPLITVLMSVLTPVYVYGKQILTKEQEALLMSPTYNCKLVVCTGEVKAHEDGVVVLVSDDKKITPAAFVDALISTDGFLYILNDQKVTPGDFKDSDNNVHVGIHTLRKRLGAPIPTPDAISMLRGEEIDQKERDIVALEAHLKQMAGCENEEGKVLICTVGLSALGATIGAALELGGNDIDSIMCSTAYGGSSQQTSIFGRRAKLNKHAFDIQGIYGNVLTSITGKMEYMKELTKKEGQKKVTIVQLEYPTNPDMKDCDLDAVQPVLESYEQATGSKVVLVLDTTFSPQSQPCKHFTNKFPVLVFNSLSKSFSGGKTTGGSLVANGHPFAQQMLQMAHKHCDLFGTNAKKCQLDTLNAQHEKAEERIANAHANAVVAAQHVEAVVAKLSGQEMKVNFVTKEQIAKNVTPATFSFNLPAPKHMADDSKALNQLAQDVVDRMVEEYSTGVKPCVSFGQENTLVYVTVPATSTQGVISEADKAKQAIGGVQLVRFSFPPTMDIEGFKNAIDVAMQRIYTE